MSRGRFEIDVSDFAPVKPSGPPRPRAGGRFVRGPLPRDWLLLAMPLAGKAMHVAIELWYRAGLTNNREVTLSLEKVAALGRFDRATASRALALLEGAGLVTVARSPGHAPRVTLLDAPAAAETPDEDDEVGP